LYPGGTLIESIFCLAKKPIHFELPEDGGVWKFKVRLYYYIALSLWLATPLSCLSRDKTLFIFYVLLLCVRQFRT